MKKRLTYAAVFLIGITACESDDDTIRDLEAPVITLEDRTQSIRPRQGEVNPATKDHLHVRFKVMDNVGISEILVDIHSNFDGHSHARTLNNDFERLNVKDIYSANASDAAFRFPEGATSVNVDGSATDIYWDGPTSRISGNILAGPYDIIISAVDLSGNQTSYADNSNYNATFYIQAPYAPVIHITNLDDGKLEGESGETLTLEGTIHQSDHDLSSDITFLWVRLAEEHDDDHHHDGHNHRILDEDFYEKMWGSSAWLDNGSGENLPDNTSLNLSEILSGDNAIVLPTGEDHLELIIWAEDANGNITRLAYEVHAH